eukprot:CAMPEP_0176423132 /NCGR_PEP_ID=MMETSP0127-20121128/10114_1 /TAXON_ID=938130 /ORGANISM="Platyophrya macrostoma, Strain WH" /LENGTH=69 /DNA_ID=CAMNT_0017804049 /DNA_START=88 /DNA_END=294 /DNA_ORIENTATION=-
MNTDKLPPSDEQVASAKQLLLKKLRDAPMFQLSSTPSSSCSGKSTDAESFCDAVVQSMRGHWNTRAAFR